MAIRVISTRILARGFEPSTLRLLDEISTRLANFDGFKGQASFEDPTSAKLFTLSDWESEDAFKAMLDDATFQELDAEIQQVCYGPAEHAICGRANGNMSFLL